MLLSKYKNSSSSPHSGATRFLAKFKREKQFAFSPISLVLLVILAALSWYPGFISLQQQVTALDQDRTKLLKRDKKIQALLRQVHQPAWLSDYPWLAWHVESKQKTTPVLTQNKAITPLNLSISLQGVASYQEWLAVLNKIFDDYSLSPKYEQIYWLETGLLDVNLELQLVSKKFAEKEYRILPTRTFNPWPTDIQVLAALKWRNERSLKVRVGDQYLSLKQGDWVPELASNLILLDDAQAVFRQQFAPLQMTTKTEKDLSRGQLAINYLSQPNLEGVDLRYLSSEKTLETQSFSFAFEQGEREHER